jgi:hypothetical protein
LVISPKVYANNFILTYYIFGTVTKSKGATVRRAVVMVFAPDCYREPS